MALSALSISASGLQAARTGLQVSAHNTANINTAGFKKQSVIELEAPSGGVYTHIRRINTPGSPYLNPLTGEISEGSNVNLVTEMANLIQSLCFARSNASAIRARDELLGFIINITV